MNIFTDGLTVLVDQAWTVFSLLFTVFWGLIIFTALFSKIFKKQVDVAEYISIGMAGWILPSALLSALVFAGVMLFGKIATTVISTLAVIALIYALFIGKPDRASLLAGSAFSGILAVFLILQLAFLKKMLLPSYFDSAEHYRLIKYFSEFYVSSGGSFSSINYYHVFFHFFSAAVSHVFQLGIVDTMLVFGQVILAILPFSLFFIVKQETGSNAAAVFTCLLAGVGWHMPSHGMDWGKYPALFSLVGIHFVLSIGYLIYRNNHLRSERFTIYWLLGFGVLASTLIHTRSLIIFAFMGIAWLLAASRTHLPILFQRLIFVVVLCILIAEIVTVQENPILNLLFEAYAGQDMFATGLVIFLLIFSTHVFQDLTFFLLMFLSLTMAGLFIPVNGLFGYGALTLLDRPYVQMLLYFPLSIFGGLGLAGLRQFLQRFSFQQKTLNYLAMFFAFGFIILNAKVSHSFYPSDCCQIVSYDDLAAIHWMDKTLPSDADVLIASTDLFVTSLESPNTLAGVDGGIWITPLISRRTTSARGALNFDQPETHADICKKNIGYVYVGSMPQSFIVSQLDGQADWYQIVFLLPGAKVYQVIGCE